MSHEEEADVPAIAPGERPAEESAAALDEPASESDESESDESEVEESVAAESDEGGAEESAAALDGSAAAPVAATATEASSDDTDASPPITPLWQRLAYARPPRWYRVAQLVLPVLLVAGAVGVHWWLNVPEKILESPRDQGAKDAKKPKPKPGKSRTASADREQPRTAEQLADDWGLYAGGIFDDEPTRSTWARRHQALINRAMVVARREGFAGAPEEPQVVLASTKCRTVRCRLVLRAPYRHELDMMVEALRRMQTDGLTIWHRFEVETIPAPAGLPAEEFYVQITAGFRVDETDSQALALESRPEPVEGAEGAAPPEGAPTKPRRKVQPDPKPPN